MPPPQFHLPTTHRRRLREVWRSAGWPYQDLIEVELLAAGLLERRQDAAGRETLRVTDAGLQVLAQTLQRNRAARDPHEDLVARVALEMQRAGRVVWRGLALRAALPAARAGTEEPAGLASEAEEGQQREERKEADDRAQSSEPRDLAQPNGSAARSSSLFTGGLPEADAPPPATRWAMAVPDVFSIRHTTREDLVEPIVHEIKVRRADLLSDLRSTDKRAAYLALSSQCWYVLKAGIADPDEVPAECGVMVAHLSATAASSALGPVLEVLRPAPRRRHRIAFATWVALARASPEPAPDEGPQDLF
ncbi:MAG: hypothetical protein ACKOD9_13075 [Rubrivivax sp.]